MTSGVDPIVINLIVFVLAVFVGYHVVWGVTPALHTPLMCVTNAISSIILVGAMLAAGPPISTGAPGSGSSRWRSCPINVFGGFLVTQRMLDMFKKKEPKPARQGTGTRSRKTMSANQLALSYLVAAVSFILALKGLVGSAHRAPGQSVRHDRHGDRGARHADTVIYSRSKNVLPMLGGMVVGGAIGAIVARRVQMTADARAGRGHALAGRPGRGIHRHCRGEQSGSDGPRCADHVPDTSSSFSSAPSSARSLSPDRSSPSASCPAASAVRRSRSAGQHFVNLALGIAMIGFGIWFCVAPPTSAMDCRSSSCRRSRSCWAFCSSFPSAAPTCRW